MGGGTPAALAADWLTSAIDQIAFNWVSSPFAMRLEQIALDWLKELFGLPAAWSGVLTSGATTANFTGLAAARRWWGLQHGVDVEEAGLAGLAAGAGAREAATSTRAPSRRSRCWGSGAAGADVRRGRRRGRLDLAALDAALRALDGEPAILSRPPAR